MHVPALVEFLSGLEQNNNRPYFVWHKPAYDVLREEFEVLTGELVARVGKFDPGLGPVDVKKACSASIATRASPRTRRPTRPISARPFATAPRRASSRATTFTSIAMAC
jgi:hypothetical protein